MTTPKTLYYVATSTVPSTSAHSIHEMRTCRDLAGLGIQVTMFFESAHSESSPTDADLHARYGVPDNFRIRRIPIGSGRARFLNYLREFGKVLRAERPDFVYGCNAFGIFSAVRHGIPCAMEMHTPPSAFTRLSRVMFSLASRSRHYRASVVNTESLRRIVLSEYPRLGANNVHTAQNGADDPGLLPPPAQLPGDRGNLRIGYIGHLYPGKGMERVADIALGMPDVDIHVFGGTEKDLARWKARLSLPNLTFHGHVPPAEAARYQQAMDILLAPYQKNIRVAGDGDLDIGEYVSPMKLFEYMAAGKAIICSDLPVLREIISEEYALVVPPDDASAWIAAIESLRDARRRDELGRKARAIFLKQFTREARIRRIADRIF